MHCTDYVFKSISTNLYEISIKKSMKEFARVFSKFIEFSSLRSLFIVVNHDFKVNSNIEMFYFYAENIKFSQTHRSDFEKV